MTVVTCNADHATPWQHCTTLLSLRVAPFTAGMWPRVELLLLLLLGDLLASPGEGEGSVARLVVSPRVCRGRGGAPAARQLPQPLPLHAPHPPAAARGRQLPEVTRGGHVRGGLGLGVRPAPARAQDQVPGVQPPAGEGGGGAM